MKREKHNRDQFSDEKLVIFLAKGDMRAFDELYNRYKNRLLYYFFRMLGNRQDKAQDFLQEIFIKLIEKPDRFNPKKIFKTWIFSVAHNMCKNEYRRLASRKIVDSGFEPDNFIDQTPEFNESQELITRIYIELNKFDEDHKSVFLLRYREGFLVKEISEMLNISEGTIKSRLYYTRKKLSDRLRLTPEYEYVYAI